MITVTNTSFTKSLPPLGSKYQKFADEVIGQPHRIKKYRTIGGRIVDVCWINYGWSNGICTNYVYVYIIPCGKIIKTGTITSTKTPPSSKSHINYDQIQSLVCKPSKNDSTISAICSKSYPPSCVIIIFVFLSIHANDNFMYLPIV